MRERSLLLIFALLASCKPSGLVWKNDFLRADLGPADTVRVFEFPFINHSAGPVRIVAVTPSCSSCSQVQWKTEPVPVGSESAVTLTFDAAGKLGPVATSALVRDDQGGTHSLRLVVHVPVVVTVEPGHLRWQADDRSRQTVKIWMNPQFPAVPTGIADQGLVGLNPALRQIDDQGHWELELSPPQTTARWQGTIEILTTRPEPRWSALPLPLFVEQS